MQIHEYILWNKLFRDLFESEEQQLRENEKTSEMAQMLIRLKDSDMETFELMPEESQLMDKEIIFFFGYDFGDANESNTQSTTAEYVVVFNREDECFTSCKYEQG